MLEQLRVSPTTRVLEDLGNCLAYRSTTWLSVYCRLGGVAMQLEVNPHSDPDTLVPCRCSQYFPEKQKDERFVLGK